MQNSLYDILRRNAFGTAIWIEAVADINTAKARILHLAERFPGEYLIFHQSTASVVANFHFKAAEVRSFFGHIVEERLSGS